MFSGSKSKCKPGSTFCTLYYPTVPFFPTTRAQTPRKVCKQEERHHLTPTVPKLGGLQVGSKGVRDVRGSQTTLKMDQEQLEISSREAQGH